MVLGPDGTATVARLVHAAEGRCTGLHFGTYDYTAALGIAAGQQAMDHPVADHAKQVMLLAAAGTGVPVSDGSTNILPVGSAEQVHGRLGAALPARRPLARARALPGLGPAPRPAADPLPGHLPVLPLRADAAAGRLRDYLGGASGTVLDEPATAKALAGFLRRGLHCGAVSADEVEALDRGHAVGPRRPRAATGVRSWRHRPRDQRAPCWSRAGSGRASSRSPTAASSPSTRPGTGSTRASGSTLADDEVLLPGLVDSHVHVNEPGPHRVGGVRLRHPRGRGRRRHHDRRHAAELDPAHRRPRRPGREAPGSPGTVPRGRRLLGRRRARRRSAASPPCTTPACSASSASWPTAGCRSSRR